MNWLRSIILVVALCFTAVTSTGLTPDERKIVLHAKEQLQIAINQNAILVNEARAARNSAETANVEAARATESAQIADTKAKIAKALEDRQYKELVRSEKENREMRPIVAQVNKWCGLGAFIYGVKRLMKCLMWFLIGGGILAVIIGGASMFGVPFLAPIAKLVIKFFAAIVNFIFKIPGWIVNFIRRIFRRPVKS